MSCQNSWSIRCLLPKNIRILFLWVADWQSTYIFFLLGYCSRSLRTHPPHLPKRRSRSGVALQSLYLSYSCNMAPKPVTRDRAWGTRYDTLDLSPPVSPHSLTRMSTAQAQISAAASLPESQDEPSEGAPHTISETKTEKMPHDASVFVGRCHRFYLIPKTIYLTRFYL